MTWLKAIINGLLQARNGSLTTSNDDGKGEAACPICGGSYRIDPKEFSREGKLCPHCGASGRRSAIVFYLCQIIHGNEMPLRDQPILKGCRVIGLSDGQVYAKHFAKKYDYVNTFYHRDPYLDITNPLGEFCGQCDVLISTEVFEHVIGPSINAFKGALSILKPGGAMVLTVPFINEGDAKEHYPGMKGYEARKIEDGSWVADIEYQDGSVVTDCNAKFHGGPGKTLEVRLFNRGRLLAELAEAGFVDVVVHDENLPQYGINWGVASRVVTARRPKCVS